MVEGYKPQDFSFFHRGGKISTTIERKDIEGRAKAISDIIENVESQIVASADEA